jgi:cardiolipin synthase
MKRLLRMILSRTSVIMMLLLLQIVFFFWLVNFLSQYAYVQTINYALSVIIVIYLIYKEENPIYKLTWIVPILIFPLFGGIFYLFYRQQNFSKKVLKRYTKIDQERRSWIKDIKEISSDKIPSYLLRQRWPHYQATQTTFLPSGESMFESMMKDLEAAKTYIFLEFFIINPGSMWDMILDILKKKVKEGVEVTFIYDDFGSTNLPYRYSNTLQSFGIKAVPFNPMRLHLNFAMNYRDHRKIIVIDGKIGYTGGINIGDEYINKISPFGHWLDAGIRLEGDAVWTLTISFLENLRFQTGKEINYLHYKGNHHVESKGLVIPFSDAPLDRELVSKDSYLSLIQEARHSIDITTPYLIIDNELMTALKLAAKSGVKVRIIIPYVPDKRLVFMVTETYVPELVDAGVEIYRYTPGFIHSKIMIVDHKHAMIGTCNLDFRSLYLHFEHSVYLFQTPSIEKMKDFFNETVLKSEMIKTYSSRNIFYRITQIILRGFSSLM